LSLLLAQEPRTQTFYQLDQLRHVSSRLDDCQWRRIKLLIKRTQKQQNDSEQEQSLRVN